MLDELVDQGEDNGVGSGLHGEGLARRQRQQDTGSQNEEQDGSCQQISPHLFVLLRENLPKHHKEFIIQNVHEYEHCINKHHLTAEGLNIIF